MGVFLSTVPSGWAQAGAAVNVWLRSVNASNSNNFCNVNTDGTPNNNNAYNSLAFAPIS